MPGFLIFLALLLDFGSFSWALDCRNGESGDPVTLEAMVSGIAPGSTVFIGELHGNADVAHGQWQILEGLRSQGHKVDVGFEFFSYIKQLVVDQFIQGLLDEGEFLKQVEWAKSMDFGFYRSQALFPRWEHGERTWAINAPRSLTGVIAKRGLKELTDEQRALLPPNLELGRPEYFDRFRELMGGHVDEKALLSYFEAQSVWDDTMAWQLAGHQTSNTKVVIVGEFHVQYGGGLPSRLLARDPHANVKSIGFVDIHQLSSEEIGQLIRPHKSWGVREDFVCLVDLPPSDRLFLLQDFQEFFR